MRSTDLFSKHPNSLDNIALTFRAFVSLFSRVWGKENLDVKHPLHSYKSQRSSDCISNTLKAHEKYESIRLLAEDVKRKTEEKLAVSNAFKENLIPKTSQTQYHKNLAAISEIDNEIEDIRINLAKYAINIAEIANRKTLELKAEKDKLLSEKLSVESRLSRVRNDLSQNKSIKSKHLSLLTKYFPEVNLERIAGVEEFHSKITRFLTPELRSSEHQLSEALEAITSEIGKIDREIGQTIDKIDSPDLIVDRVYELSKSHAVAKSEVKYFEIDNSVKTEFKEAKDSLSEEKLRVLKLVEDVLNDKTRRYVTKIYDEERRSPILRLAQNNYKFEVVEDTGTGKAYSNLILLDLAFLETTKLPFLIHDSVLFKNIQNSAVARLIELYESIDKQTFIAIDEIEKYGEEAADELRKQKVIKLSDKEVLYTRDWRK